MNITSFLRLLLAVVGCVLVGCDLRLERTSTPVASATAVRVITDTPIPTPFVMPTAPPPPTPTCPDAPRERLIVGERGHVLPDDPRPVNVRSDAGTENRVVTTIPINGVFTVLEGPICEDEYSWYKVRYRETEGWLAEGDLTSYYVEPYGIE
ncbi:MAG: SH3 domain-containing protein [Chloroflexi bacterium]|nr:SH3 domain-containing protein [Chloroflexota bacterium]MCC6894018.1 SH3 domain-containing protein [Anaerolineae bacterium]